MHGWVGGCCMRAWQGRGSSEQGVPRAPPPRPAPPAPRAQRHPRARTRDGLAPRRRAGLLALPPRVVGGAQLPGAADHAADAPVSAAHEVLERCTRQRGGEGKRDVGARQGEARRDRLALPSHLATTAGSQARPFQRVRHVPSGSLPAHPPEMVTGVKLALTWCRRPSASRSMACKRGAGRACKVARKRSAWAPAGAWGGARAAARPTRCTQPHSAGVEPANNNLGTLPAWRSRRSTHLLAQELGGAHAVPLRAHGRQRTLGWEEVGIKRSERACVAAPAAPAPRPPRSAAAVRHLACPPAHLERRVRLGSEVAAGARQRAARCRAVSPAQAAAAAAGRRGRRRRTPSPARHRPAHLGRATATHSGRLPPRATHPAPSSAPT